MQTPRAAPVLEPLTRQGTVTRPVTHHTTRRPEASSLRPVPSPPGAVSDARDLHGWDSWARDSLTAGAIGMVLDGVVEVDGGGGLGGGGG